MGLEKKKGGGANRTFGVSKKRIEIKEGKSLFQCINYDVLISSIPCVVDPPLSKVYGGRFREGQQRWSEEQQGFCTTSDKADKAMRSSKGNRNLYNYALHGEGKLGMTALRGDIGWSRQLLGLKQKEVALHAVWPGCWAPRHRMWMLRGYIS